MQEMCQFLSPSLKTSSFYLLSLGILNLGAQSCYVRSQIILLRDRVERSQDHMRIWAVQIIDSINYMVTVVNNISKVPKAPVLM